MINLIPPHLDQTDSKYVEKNLLTGRQFNIFRTVTEEDVKAAIRDAPLKHCELDPIPTTLLKQMMNAVAPTITEIINTSLQSEIFSISLKEVLL